MSLELVIFSSEVAPSQERNLEQQLECQVMDRTGLILDIFSLRARSFEGKLQGLYRLVVFARLAQLQLFDGQIIPRACMVTKRLFYFC
jgi:50S ribosomal subunit-associated GTPase HflX